MTPASRFAAMDGLRGVAALMIVVFHYAIAAGAAPPAASAYLAVDLFFMLSGFVIALAYERRLREGMGFWSFAWVRIVRLYPLALLGTIVSLVALLGPGLWPRIDPARLDWLARDGLKALLFVPHFRGDNTLYPLNPPMWSLLFEIIVNLAYAAALPWLTDRRLMMLAVLGGTGVVAAAVAYGNLDVGATTATLGGGLARVIWGFTVGVLIYRSWTRGRFERWPRCPALLLPLLFAAACLPAYRGSYVPAAAAAAVLVGFRC